MFIYLNKKGQATLEYGIIIAVIVAALLTIQVYFKRGLQGRIRQASDDIGDQFSPGVTTGTRTTNSNANSFENIAGGSFFTGDMPTQRTTTNQTQNRVINEATGAANAELWP